MVLPRQTVDIPVGQGLDQKTGEPNVQAGKLLRAENVRLRKIGSLQCRPGYEALGTYVSYPTTGSAITGGYRVLACEDELLLDTGTRLYSYLPSVAASWILRDTAHQATVTRREYGERGLYTKQQPCEAIYHYGTYCQAWRSCKPGQGYNSVTVRAVDASTGARHKDYTFTGTGETKFRLIGMGTKAYLFFCQGDNIKASVLDLTMPYGLWAPPVTVVPAIAGFEWEVCECPGKDYFYLAFIGVDETGGLVRVLSSLAIHQTAALSLMPHANVAICAEANGNITVAYDNNGEGAIIVDTFDEGTMALNNSIVLDADIAGGIGVVSGVTCLGACVGYGTSYRGKAFISYSVQRQRPTVTRVWQLTGAGEAEACTQTYHVIVLSQPRCIDDRLYLVVTIPNSSATGSGADPHLYYNAAFNLDPKDTGPYGSPQWGAFLMQPEPYITARMPDDSPPSRAVSRVSWGTAVHPQIQYWPVSLGQGRDAAELVAAIPQKTEDIDTSNSNETVSEGFDVFTLGLVSAYAHAPADIHLPVAANHELVLSGGVPACYDSNKLCEYGFHWWPAITLASSSTTEGQLRASMTYDYAVTYEWADCKGVWHRSAPSLYRIVNGLVDVKKTVTFQVPCMTVTDRQDQYDATYPIRVCLYRTRVQQDPDDPTQYRAIPGVYHLLDERINDPAQAYVEFTDDGVSSDSADNKLREKRILYTVGSVVENIAPPAFRHLAYHVNRFWGISADDPECIWFSKLHSFNELPGFFDGWVIRIAGADLRALASLDGKLIAFSRDRVYAVFGSGPSDTDQGNDLSEPQLITPSIGCIDARSVVQTPVGVFFQGESGIYLLDRSMTVKPIGLPIEDTLKSYSIVTGSALIEADQEVRFTVSDTAGTASRVLVYSYLLDQWFVWTTPATSPVSPLITSSTVSMRQDEPRHTMITSTGRVLREQGLTDPDGSRPTQSFKTAWLHMAGIQGYQRVRRLSVLGDYMSRCTVQLYGYVDYKSSVAFSRSWTADEIDTMAANGRVQLQLHVPTQKCEAMSLWLVVAPLAQVAGSPTASTEAVGVRFQGVSLEVGAKRGQSKNHSSGERK